MASGSRRLLKRPSDPASRTAAQEWTSSHGARSGGTSLIIAATGATRAGGLYLAERDGCVQACEAPTYDPRRRRGGPHARSRRFSEYRRGGAGIAGRAGQHVVSGRSRSPFRTRHRPSPASSGRRCSRSLESRCGWPGEAMPTDDGPHLRYLFSRGHQHRAMDPRRRDHRGLRPGRSVSRGTAHSHILWGSVRRPQLPVPASERPGVAARNNIDLAVV